MARRYWGDESPLGRRIGFGRDPDTPIEIVGVVRDIRSQQLRSEAPRFVYVPYRQNQEFTQLTFYVRAAGEGSAAAAAIRQAVTRLDPGLPVYDLRTMEAQVGESLFVERMVAVLSMAFGALATVLAAIGLYGVMSYAVAGRTREIGIRMALGAGRTGVLWLVLKEVAVLASAGAVAGLGAAFYLARRVESQLFGVSPLDPLTLAAGVGLLLAVGLLAGFVPARRAATIDPMLALRAE